MAVVDCSCALLAGHGFQVFVITSRQNPIQNLYFRIFGFTRVYLEDLNSSSIDIPSSVIKRYPN